MISETFEENQTGKIPLKGRTQKELSEIMIALGENLSEPNKSIMVCM